MSKPIKFTRFSPGLYVDTTNSYVITRDTEAGNGYAPFYTIRELLGFGPCLNGLAIFPDYGDIHLGVAYSLQDAKAQVLQMIAEKEAHQ